MGFGDFDFTNNNSMNIDGFNSFHNDNFSNAFMQNNSSFLQGLGINNTDDPVTAAIKLKNMGIPEDQIAASTGLLKDQIEML